MGGVEQEHAPRNAGNLLPQIAMKNGYIPPSDMTPGQVQRIINHLPNRVGRDDAWREVLRELNKTERKQRRTHPVISALAIVGSVIAGLFMLLTD